MSFAESTHAKSWIFNQPQLSEIRQKSYDTSVSALRPGIDPLTLQEVLLLLRHYEFMIQRICKTASLPDKCQTTATTFFKRFFLSFTPMDHDPKLIMLTCIYVAGKVEEHRVDMNEFCKQTNVVPKMLLDREMGLLESLHFQLKVYHPYRALHGFTSDIQDNYPHQQVVTDPLWNTAREQLDITLTTDLLLLYPPAQLALAALLYSSQKHGVDNIVHEYINQRFGAQDWFQELSSHVATITKTIEEARSPPDMETIKNIDRKLRYCTNPELNPQSEEYRAIKSKRDAEKEAKRQAKISRRIEQQRLDQEDLTGIRADGSLVHSSK